MDCKLISRPIYLKLVIANHKYLHLIHGCKLVDIKLRKCHYLRS